MAALFSSLFGGAKPSASPIPAGDSDFADFAEAPDPSPASISAASSASLFGNAASATGAAVPYTKWYNIHERYSLSDFRNEGYILIIMLVLVGVHLWGTRVNRSKAKSWMATHGPALKREFALVGFGGRKTPSATDVEADGLANSLTSAKLELPEDLLKEKSVNNFTSYATGRQNVAFVDVSLTLFKRFNPFMMIAEYGMSFFFDTMPPPVEKMDAVLYPFDGKEALTVPGLVPGAEELRNTKSGYDGFVWAVVNKESMKRLRDERYDVSITTTKDNAKLPIWTTVMSESAEVTDLLLTPGLIKAIEEAGDLFDYLIITDQPVDKPTTLDETVPKKRIYISIRLPGSTSDYPKTLALFEYFLRLPDQLVQSARFRPEVMRKIRATREETIKKLQKADEDQKAEERALDREKAKKLKRELELKGLDAKAQKKYLEKEKEKEQRKQQKKMTMRG